MEAALLGLFMIAACGLATLLEHPASPLRRALPDADARRLVMGMAMGITAIRLITSPWGRRSGAHMNPALTLTYLRLGKIAPADARGYVVAQFLGAALAVLAVRALLGTLAGHPAVRFAATTPGASGVAAAFAAEVAISFVLMSVVLVASNDARLAPYTPRLCGALVAAYIALEAPISGMSMNPARSFASALGAGHWTALWVYFTAPPLGMLVAAEAYVRARGAHRVRCAKLDHRDAGPCIFRCDIGALRPVVTASRPAHRTLDTRNAGAAGTKGAS